MNVIKQINIARDFSINPGPRKKEQGDNSAEKFMNELFLPALHEAMKTNSVVEVVLDGISGYPPSFLEEVFGGAARILKNKEINTYIKITSTIEPYVIEEITEYIKNAF